MVTRIKISMLFSVILLTSISAYADTTTVSTLAQLRSAVLQSDQNIVMTPGDYNFEEGLASGSRDITCSGSNNTITLTGVYINVPVGCVGSVYFIISGSGNTVIGGEIEDTYKNGMTEVTDFSAYNQDRTYQANGLGGDPVMKISGDNNLLDGFELTTRGSFPYGYGSIYGIGSTNVFGLDKRCGILTTGNDNIIDNVIVHHRAFGHGIFYQSGADGNIVRNTLVEGRVRQTSEFYNESNTYDLPYLTDFKYPLSDNIPIPIDEVNSLCEDGIRMYNETGSITVENCTVMRMRGGLRLYLGASADVSNCTAIDCGATNYNLPTGATVVNSSGNFAFAPLSDFRLSRSRTDVEWTIIPSPHAIGSHNLCDVLGSDHNITFHRTPGPLDKISRAIVITDDNSTIVNETEYPIILESTASGNNITSCGPVIDNGSNNTIQLSDCAPFGASDTIEAEAYINMSGVSTGTTTDDGGGDKVSGIDADDWIDYEIVTSEPGTYWMDYRVSGNAGEFILLLNDESIETISFDATGGDEVWSTERSLAPVYLPEGVNTLRVKANLAGWNLNWIQLLPACYDATFEPFITTTNSFGVATEALLMQEATVYPGSTVNIDPTEVFGGNWTWTGPNSFTSTERTISLSDIQKIQSGTYIVTIINECGQVTTDSVIINVQDTQIIEAETYTTMSGITTESTTDDDGGSKISSITSGDWVEYEIDIEFSGLYILDYRVYGGNNGATFTASIDGSSIEQIDFTSQDWATVSSGSTIYLKAGVQTLRLTSESDGWEINWIQLNTTETVKDCLLPYVDTGFSISNEVVSWTSGVMDISCENELDLHFIIKSEGDMSASDSLNIYYSLDGGDKLLLSKITGSIEEVMVSATAISGTTLELFVQSQTSNENTSYDISKILVINSSDPLAQIEAEDFDDRDGGNEEDCSDTGGGTNMGSLSDGKWLMYSNINLSSVKSLDLRLANESTGAIIEVRLDSLTGTLIGSVEVPNTGDWQSWQTASTSLINTVGFHDVYLVFIHADGSVGNINWLQFSETFIKGPTDPYERFEAEINDKESGIVATTTSDIDGDEEVGDLQEGDYIMFSEINIEQAISIDARVASAVGGVIEVRVGSATKGDIIAFIDVPNTGDTTTWQTVSTTVDFVEGENDIYFVFKGDGDDLFRLNWLKFSDGSDSFPRLEVEDYTTAIDDIRTPSATDDEADNGTGEVIKLIKPGYWLHFSDVDLSNAKSIYTRFVTTKEDASVEVRIDALDGELIATIDMYNTEDWSSWKTAKSNLSDVTGIHDVYFVYQTESSTYACYSNWFQFSEFEVAENIDMLGRIEAEDNNRASGTAIASTSDMDGEEELTIVQNEDWILFKNIDLTDITNVDIRYATSNECKIYMRYGSYDGSYLGLITLPSTDANWQTLNANLLCTVPDGLHDVYLIFKGSQDDLFKLNWIQFQPETSAISNNVIKSDIVLYPNPVSNELVIENASGATVELYNMLGCVISTSSIKSIKQTIDLSTLTEGYYLVKATKTDGTVETFKIIKE